MNFHYSLHGRVGEKEKFNAKVWTKKNFLPSSVDFFFAFLSLDFFRFCCDAAYVSVFITHTCLYVLHFWCVQCLSLFYFSFLLLCRFYCRMKATMFFSSFICFHTFWSTFKRKNFQGWALLWANLAFKFTCVNLKFFSYSFINSKNFLLF